MTDESIEKGLEYLNKKKVPILYVDEFHKAITKAVQHARKEERIRFKGILKMTDVCTCVDEYKCVMCKAIDDELEDQKQEEKK